jgi:DNA-binding XRE family transcriptional regulator
MPRKPLPRIAEVAPGDEPMTLHIRWVGGGENVVDVAGMIQSFRIYAPLRHSAELFQTVRVGEYGADVVWTDEIDMSTDTLWRLAEEQAGRTMTAADFRRWRERRAYTLDTAAKVLGISRRMIAYYEQGGRAIPRVVALATRGLDNEAAE